MHSRYLLMPILVMASALAGCTTTRGLPIVYMPTPPKECHDVMEFHVEKLEKGKSNAAKLSVDMAKEGALRQKEHEIAKVCAEYALKTAGAMKDADSSNKVSDNVIPAPESRKKRSKSAPAEDSRIELGS